MPLAGHDSDVALHHRVHPRHHSELDSGEWNVQFDYLRFPPDL